jgi:type II secretory pathway component PulF
MAVFAFQAIDQREQAACGTIAADTPALARQALRARGLAIASLKPLRPAAPGLRARLTRLGGTARRAEAVTELWQNLAVLLAAGVPLADGLGVCLKQQRGALQGILRQVAESVQNGLALDQALALHPLWFEPLSLTLVRVGEQSGQLAEALAELADFQTRRQALRSRLGSALIYPAILCLVGTGVVIFLMSHVVPQLLEVLTAAGRGLPAPTRLLKSLTDGLVAHGPLLAAWAALLVVGVGALRRSAWGRRWSERAILAIPLVGELVRKSWVARIAMMLATLLRTDVRFIEALRTVRAELPHRLYADELQRLETAIEAGASISQPLEASRLMPPLVVHLLAVGQESGELPKMLDQLRQAYERQVQTALTRCLAVLEPLLILVLAGVIGFVVFATLLPILETTKVLE